MGLFSEIKIVIRATTRFGAYKRFLQSGLSPQDARRESEKLYPPTTKDLEYETYLAETGRGPLSRIPWFSTLALAYPIVTMIRISSHTSNSAYVIGSGVTHLGYILLAAGIFSGRFEVFNLSRRSTTIGCAVLVVALGIILINLRIS